MCRKVEGGRGWEVRVKVEHPRMFPVIRCEMLVTQTD